MATLSNHDGLWSIQFPNGKGGRHSLRLGRVGKNNAIAIRSHVEHLRSAKKSGQAMPEATAAWLRTIDNDLHGRMAKLNLVAGRTETPKIGLGAMIDAYIARRTDLKERSTINLKQARRTMVEFFGELRDPRTINRGEAADWGRHLRTVPLAPPTIAAHVKRARQIFRDGIDRGITTINPFDGIKLASQVNADRGQYIPASDVMKVMDACPDDEWRLIFALARFAGLRTPSETHLLKWEDLNFHTLRMKVQSPKTEHHQGKASRTVPIFERVFPYLEKRLHSAAGSTYVISMHRGENLRTQAERIIAKSGVPQWPRLFQNLRASCETDLATDFPLHVACEWIGNSQLVAARHYLKVKEDHFTLASGAKSGAAYTGPGLTPDTENAETALKSQKQGNLLPSTGFEQLSKIRELLNWHENAMQNAVHRLEQAAPLIRENDISRLRAAIDAAKGGSAPPP